MMMIISYGILYPKLFCLFLGAIAVAAYYRFFHARKILYNYSLTSYLAMQGFGVQFNPLRIRWLMRMILLSLIALIVSRPQKYNGKERLHFNGIDIVLALDVSASMCAFDDFDDPEPRIQTALKEAEKFVDARVDDQIGLVLFAKEVVSRVPLTVDKKMIKQIIKTVRIGVLNEQETMLGCGILAGINRLKDSQAQTKLLVVLTDGLPSESDIPIAEVIEVARKLGVKIYTIGVGNSQQAYINHPSFGVVPVQTPLNDALLEEVAHKTGGAFFRAYNPEQMRQAYKKIDELEKTEREGTLLYHGSDWFKPFLLAALVFLFLECLVAATCWLVV